MDFKELLAFLKELAANNDRDWFSANKARYDKLRKDFESYVGKLIPQIASFDSNIRIIPAKDCIFRIFRDTRFAKDKTPYKTNFGAYIAAEGRKSLGAGYYLHIEPNNCFLAGGVYMPTPEMLKAIRMEILYQYSEFQKLLKAKDFKKYFGDVTTYEKLSRAPKDFPTDFEGVEYLKFKSFVMVHNLPNKTVLDPGLDKYAIQVFKAMLPFNSYLRRSLE